MSYVPKTEPDHDLTGYPKGVPYIIGNEGCERFSFYGMKAILYVYIVGLLLQMGGMEHALAKKEATATTHLFVAGVYFVPLVGGIIADRLLGKYKTIMWLSVVYCIGHLALAIFEDTTWQQEMFGAVFIDRMDGLFIGLFLICLGSGGIKPCVSAHVGDQFGKSNWHLLQKIFNAFYFIINFGSTFSTLLIPVIRGDEIWTNGVFMGYTGSVGWAFGIPGILMGLATIAFWMGRKVFIHVEPKPGGKLGLLDAGSGASLFMVIGWPMFFSSFLPWWGSALVMAGAFVLFAILFSARQRIEQDDGFLAVMFYTLLGIGKTSEDANIKPSSDDPNSLQNHSFWGPAARKFGQEAAEGPVAVLKIISVFFLVSVFWALFDQHSSTWIEQARSMDRVVEMSLSGWLGTGAAFGVIVGGALALTLGPKVVNRAGGFAVGIAIGVLLGYLAYEMPEVKGHIEPQPSQVPSSNPILVMLLIPYTTWGLYPLLKKLGWDPKPLRRMTLGMLMAAMSFVAVALIQRAIDAGEATGEKVHIVWQLIPYAIITLSEVMVSVTGLEFAYSQAPKRMKSVIMGFWLLNVSFGSLLVVFLAGFKDLSAENFFWVFAVLMAGAAVIFGIRGKFYRYQDYTQ